MAEPRLGALLLAAGGSSRLGRSKQLLRLGGQTLVRRSANLLISRTDTVVVVTGAQAKDVAAALEGLPVQVEVNTRWREGVGSSIALGTRAMHGAVDGMVLMLCDQYRIDADDLDRLSAAWREEPARIVAARWSGAFGPPVIFPRRFFQPLQRLSGDLGARRLLVNQRASVRFLPLDNAAYDVDDEVELEWLREFERSEEFSREDPAPGTP